jgi:hypothetical protein
MGNVGLMATRIGAGRISTGQKQPADLPKNKEWQFAADRPVWDGMKQINLSPGRISIVGAPPELVRLRCWDCNWFAAVALQPMDAMGVQEPQSLVRND